VVVIGQDESARQLYRASLAAPSLNQAVLCLPASDAVPQNLPPALAQTIPNLPALKEERSFAVICSGFTCQPPIFDAATLGQRLQQQPTL
jgi:hypothetical protein